MNLKNEDGLSDIDKARNGLQGAKLYTVAKETGLSYPTLKKLHDGEEHNFTIGTIETVLEWIEKQAN